MPHFNEFRTNEELLGKVLVARQKFDLSASEDEQLEVRQFINELEEKKLYKKTDLYLRFVGLLMGKKYIKLKDKFGQKIIRELKITEETKPELRLSLTIDRQMDFGDDVNAWRNYIHEENIRSEERRIQKDEQSKYRKKMVEAYSEIINKVMMRIN